MSRECPVCLEPYKDPKVLSCGHTFCLKCLSLMATKVSLGGLPANDLVRFSCPECRQEHILPNGGVANLPTNIALVRLNSEEEEGQRSTAGSSGQSSSSKLKRKAKYQLCPQHGQDMCYYCKTCSVVLCGDCIVLPGQIDHMLHIRVRLEDQTGELAAHLVGKLENSKSRTTMLRNLHSAWTQAGRKSMQSSLDAREVLLERKQAILDCVEGCYTQLLFKLEEKGFEGKLNNTKALSSLAECIQGLEDLQSRTENLIQSSSPQALYENHDAYCQALMRISPQEQEMCDNVPKWNQSTLENVDGQLFADLVSAMFGSFQDRNVFVLPKPILLMKFNTKCEEETQENNVWDIAITEDGHIAVADFAHSNIKLFTQTGELVKVISKERPEMSYTRVSTLPGFPEYLLVVESTENLLKWHVPSNTVSKFYDKQMVPTLDFCHAVGVTSYNDQPTVVVPDGPKNILHFFDFEGREVASQTIETCGCRYIASHPSQDFLVVLHHGSKLSAYRGEKTLWTKSMQEGQIPYVCGLAMDHRGYILVCHPSQDCVNVYFPTGELSHTLLSRPDNMESPQGIAYDPKSHLLVIAEALGDIKVFKW